MSMGHKEFYNSNIRTPNANERAVNVTKTVCPILRIKSEKCFQLNGDSLALYLNKFGCGREGHIRTLIFKLPYAEKVIIINYQPIESLESTN